MLRIFSVIFLVIIMLFIFIGCSPEISDDGDDPGDIAGDVPNDELNNNPYDVIKNTPGGNDIMNQSEIQREEWSAQYFRLSWSGRGMNVVTIHSVSELLEFHNELGFDYSPRMQTEETDLFLSAEDFDDGFFAERFLTLILNDEPSGSIRHKVISVSQGNGILQINIDRHQPEMQTADMAAWVIAIDLSNDYADFDVAVIWENVPYDITELSAPAGDLLHIEFFGNQLDDGTYDTITAVMFVFDGVHDMFSIGAINNWGRLLSFEDTALVEHDYTTISAYGSHSRLLFDGKTGFLLFFDTPIYDATYGVGTYIISFDYFGILMETEPATVVERTRRSQ